MFDSLTFKLQYRSSHDNLFEHFYKPCLNNAIKYDRASGYFTSESLKLLAEGLDVFLFNGGQIRIVANPNLSQEDIEAIEKGHAARESVIERRLLKEIELSYKTIEDDTLNVLSWLIYRGQLDIKIAFTTNGSIYHEKFGIFTDQNNNSIAFSGSANETYNGLSQNFEKIDVYSNKQDKHRIDNAIVDFEKLWANETNELKVINLPETIRKKMIEYKSSVPPLALKNKELEANERRIEPRKYQKEAINSWKTAGYKGILEMATGTGKTITSLLAAKDFNETVKTCVTVIVVPFQHLVNQWEKDINFILGTDVVKCMGSQSSWINKAKEMVQEYNLGLIDQFVVVTTYKTATSSHFKNLFRKLNNSAMLITDECHYITFKGFKDFPFEKFKARLGLSATPDRWWDEEGTSYMKKSIGEVVYEYTLDQAISNEKLTKYDYYPHLVEFNESEMLEYNKITQQIINHLNKDDIDTKEKLEGLFRKRSNLINKARNKIKVFLQDFKTEDLDKISHTLVYCAPGDIEMIVKSISDLGVKVSKFNSDVNNKDREKLLTMFEQAQIQVLVAIKCLDEGVDVPATKTAYFLASTSNPRELVQRRGRILRNHKGKSFAVIHDYIVLPIGLTYDDFYKIAVKELPRFSEFNDSAINTTQNKIEMSKVLEDYNLTHLMYKKPWDVYKETKELYDNDSIK
ncbi:DEAD/DEAH box helicase family protein [Staphylococcus sp. 18_1_E_LY]|uniref:DEAD/DEAH box helicase family protein n=1 Tax=Staphylococcus lloydii TaxID=2781774 RepID=A0A7T1B026_9STAP|nr:DEAD/DEAH box helicase family protein [Staphylococcus lloydii]MBF7019887.1 DEAD/DEAH box helicase family protein [Staphylococcus lloydii]MBF7027570.1 DEAD/DEAH box helicase family protein [Staphylococcus lloydii]QPM75258.1 DEAD/DEAH box helicase family protein [Staphylococcus lloydii]